MNFGEQFKNLRNEKGYTQDYVAEKLFVSRQAVSNWENDKNLPDIEMLIKISFLFGVSLDSLILGENDMNNMREKLIDDMSEGKRTKRNLTMVIIGAMLMVIGIGLILIKACSVEYIDEMGILHENFFLLPIGFLFILSGFITFMISGIKNLVKVLKSRK